jgi:hypothetical protein
LAKARSPLGRSSAIQPTPRTSRCPRRIWISAALTLVLILAWTFSLVYSFRCDPIRSPQYCSRIALDRGTLCLTLFTTSGAMPEWVSTANRLKIVASRDPRPLWQPRYERHQSFTPGRDGPRLIDDVWLPLWIPLLLTSAITAFIAIKQPRQLPLEPCASCGYELTGLASLHPCPECGALRHTAIPTEQTATGPFVESDIARLEMKPAIPHSQPVA